MEAAFGCDFSNVEVKTGQGAAMKAIGAEAAAQGESVAFASISPSPRLVAHELTHVVQARENGAGSGAVNRKPIVSGSSSPAEKEADAVADRVVSTGVAGAVNEAPAGLVQRFAPRHHEEATVGGLTGTFSRREIAAIYQANWERDYAQGHPTVASAVIAWSDVKRASAGPPALFKAAATIFKGAIYKVIDVSVCDAATERSLGGTKTLEHFDQPDEKASREADERWSKSRDELAGYIEDAKAHAKDRMVSAIDVYRVLKGRPRDRAGIGRIDNWRDGAKPEGYSTAFPRGYDDKRVADRTPVRRDTYDRAEKAGALVDRKHNAKDWQLIGQHLGRAMHAIEDFWAHSNWIELAERLRRHTLKHPGHASVSNRRLFTGTFERSSEVHALGHKLLALSSAFLRDFDLMLEIYGRKRASMAISHSNRRPWWMGFDSDSDDAFDPLVAKSCMPTGELIDVARATNAVEEYAQSRGNTTAKRADAVGDFLTSRDWLVALKGKAKIMIAKGDREAGRHSHGKIAKDQHEAGRDHATAKALATKANQMIFGPLRAIMDERNPKKSLAATQKQLALVDRMLRAPSTRHPLWPTFLSVSKSK